MFLVRILLYQVVTNTEILGSAKKRELETEKAKAKTMKKIKTVTDHDSLLVIIFDDDSAYVQRTRLMSASEKPITNQEEVIIALAKKLLAK